MKYATFYLSIIATAVSIGALTYNHHVIQQYHHRLEADYSGIRRELDEGEYQSRLKQLEHDELQLREYTERLLGAIKELMTQPSEAKIRKAILGDVDRMANEIEFDKQMKYLESIGAKQEADRLRDLRSAIYNPPPK